MRRRLKYLIGSVIVALALISPQFLQAQGVITLESLSARIDRQDAQIAALQQQVDRLLALSGLPPDFPSEGVVELTEAQYFRWFDDEMLRISNLAEEWEEAFESGSAARFVPSIFAILETTFEFYEAHSRIVTPSAAYEKTQAVLDCFMDPLEPYRDLENASFAEGLSFLAALGSSDQPEDFFVDCDMEAFDELVELLSLE
ncbi:MAG: hypothetical protein OXF54_02050 [Caldilineaceae bacterium]|nr:hypothetical protein [Caldilineaceae bacterium]MCY4078998.1 hypothetical protein [Caldilineaceae bacterium]